MRYLTVTILLNVRSNETTNVALPPSITGRAAPAESTCCDTLTSGRRPEFVGAGSTGVALASSSRIVMFTWASPMVAPFVLAKSSRTANCSAASASRSPMILIRNDFITVEPENVRNPLVATKSTLENAEPPGRVSYHTEQDFPGSQGRSS